MCTCTLDVDTHQRRAGMDACRDQGRARWMYMYAHMYGAHECIYICICTCMDTYAVHACAHINVYVCMLDAPL